MYGTRILVENAVQVVAELIEVSASYGNVDVLHGLTLRLHAGRVFTMLGPNGAGKSTVVRALTGTLPLRQGRLSFDAARTKPNRRPVSVVPQEIALYSWLTASENCLAFARLDGTKASLARARAIEVLRLCNCTEIAATRISQLSGGYRRRVNIAVALMSNPALLILDEPTVGLDTEARRVVIGILKAVAAAGTAILLVTHDFEVASEVSDEVGVLLGGSLVAQGTAASLLTEMFMGKRLAELIFAIPPDSIQKASLIASGLVQGKSQHNWFVIGPQSYDAEALIDKFMPAGLQAAEIRVRDPVLEDFYNIVIRRGVAQ